MIRETTAAQRPSSPSWHRRQRKARAAARLRLHQGRGTAYDHSLLEQHHGSMAPKAPPDKQPSRAPAKGKGKGGENAQASKLEYALPPAMVTCLQAITARSTQDLWGTPTSIPGDMSVEQQAQRRAAAIGKLSKRLSGDMRAKEELRLSLQQWALAVAVHLAGLVQRAKALGDKVDADLAEALREMRAALDQQPSSTTAEQVALAADEVGRPIWNAVQEQEMFRIAAGLRAFGTVDFPGRNMDAGSEISFGGVGPSGLLGADPAGHVAGPVGPPAVAPLAAGTASSWGAEGGRTDAGLPGSGHTMLDEARPTRWKRRQGADPHRPSKSPRREEPPAAPWPAVATGRTPESVHRCPVTEIQEAPAGQSATLTWEAAWRQLLLFAVEHGTALIGETVRDSGQDAVLPLQDATEARQEIIASAESLWGALQDACDADVTSLCATLCLRLQEVLNQLRLCPSALGGVRQGVVLLAQVTVGNLLDPYAYAPSTAQEWLYPAAIVEHGSLAKGHVPHEISQCPAIQTLLARRCPAFWEVPGDGITELF